MAFMGDTKAASAVGSSSQLGLEGAHFGVESTAVRLARPRRRRPEDHLRSRHNRERVEQTASSLPAQATQRTSHRSLYARDILPYENEAPLSQQRQCCRTASLLGAALLRRGVFALFMGLFARGCVSPVLLSGGQQPSQRVPASFRRPAEPRNGTEHRRSVPLGRAPFWTFARRSGTVPWEGRQTCDGCDDRIPGTYIRRGANRRPLHRSPEPRPRVQRPMLSSRMPKPSSRPAKPGR